MIDALKWSPVLIANIVRGLPATTDTQRLILGRDTVTREHFRRAGCAMDGAMIDNAIETGKA